MEMTFRWFGEGNDTVPLTYIKQIPGVRGIVWALHTMSPGVVWDEKDIAKEVQHIESHGFHAKIVESVNVNEAIKIGNSERDYYIDNYKKTIENLAKYGVEVICYNFMPVFDWVRTNMREQLPDGSTALFYEKEVVEKLDVHEMADQVLSSSKLTLPGWEPEKIEQLQKLLEEYKDITEDDLRNNLAYFLQEVLPVAEKCGVKLAIHPDDPPWSVFGLPRIVKNENDLEQILAISDSPSNGLTLCTGSLGAASNNDVVDIIKKFANRAPFIHLRNIKRFANGDFIETSHFTADGSINLTAIVKYLNEIDYQGYIRPDHGRHIWDEKSRPGYGLYDRALGIMYLQGLWDASTMYREEKANVSNS